MKSNHRRKSIPWLHRRPALGTVYLMQSELQADLFKVGFTKRKTKARRAELSGKVDGRLLIRYTITMPHAYFVEQLLIRRLRRRMFGKGDKRGTEWFRLRKCDTIEQIIDRIDQAASHTRLISRLKCSWPAGTEIKSFRSTSPSNFRNT